MDAAGVGRGLNSPSDPTAPHTVKHLECAACVPCGVSNSMGTLPRVDAILHALSDQSRRTVMEVLRDHPATVSELAELLPIARPGVSRHLRVLREAGLVDVEQDAQWRIYRLRAEPLVELDTWLGPYRAVWEQRLDALHTEIVRGKREQRISR